MILLIYFFLIFLSQNALSSQLLNLEKKGFSSYHKNNKTPSLEKSKNQSIILKYKDVKMIQKYLNNILKLSKNSDHVLIVRPEKPSPPFRQKEIDEKILLHSNNAQERSQNTYTNSNKNKLQLKQKNNNFENDEIFQSFKINDELKKEILQVEEVGKQ